VTRAAVAVFVVAIVCLAASFLLAQEQRPLNMAHAAQAAEAKPAPPHSAELEAALSEYELWNLKHRAATFQWQFTASKIIFWMVLVLVLAGVSFSAVQFGVALRRRTDFTDAEVAVGVEGVKIRSQFLGIITLALSLAFFYLYLKTVYPIVELPERSAIASEPKR
jgi:hypothetical protein